ncbi:MAG: glycosyltransferase, partial [Gemmatimonadota bacterium]|nr:glycosyltransferase [Gemmatimonadota bacterium]
MGQKKEASEEIFLSLVIPVFNEEESLPHLWVQIESALATVEWSWEAIFVDDGSTDGSFAVLGELAKQHPQVCA